MKAQDLMIGDWVYGIDGKGGKHPCRINTIDIYPQNRTPRVVTSGGYGYQQENLEPIPLTPEILEENGFKKEGSWFIIEDDYYDVSIREITDSIWRVKYCNTEFSTFDCVLHIAFIHELQHALRLCGIEKEIVL